MKRENHPPASDVLRAAGLRRTPVRAGVLEVLASASGPLAAKLAGRTGDGFIMTSGKDRSLYEELNAAMEEGARTAERDPASNRRALSVGGHDVDDATECTDAVTHVVEAVTHSRL